MVTTAAVPWTRLPAAPVEVLVLEQEVPEYLVPLRVKLKLRLEDLRVVSELMMVAETREQGRWSGRG